MQSYVLCDSHIVTICVKRKKAEVKSRMSKSKRNRMTNIY